MYYILFLTLDGLVAYAAERPDREWCECSLFFLDCQPGELETHERVSEVVRYAEKHGRVSWRKNVADPFGHHALLNGLLRGNLLTPFNAGLAQEDGPVFLKAAVESANNGNGSRRLEVVA